MAIAQPDRGGEGDRLHRDAAGARTRLRTSGAATPGATIPQAVARIAFDRRTRAVYGRLARSGARARAPLARERAPARRGLHERRR